jgi:aldose 1-epimerase
MEQKLSKSSKSSSWEEVYVISEQKSEAVFRGSKLTKLILDGVQVISSSSSNLESKDFQNNNNYNYLTDGSYLMYPWVGRIENDLKIKSICKLESDVCIDYPFRDEKNFPLHGFYANSSRQVQLLNSKTIILKSINSGSFFFPSFEEIYTIEEKALTVKIKFYNESSLKQYFAFGYHPYIEIQSELIDDFTIKSNLNKKCKLDKNLFPIVNTEGKIIMEDFEFKGLLQSEKFDDLFFNSVETSDDSFDEESYISISSSLTGKTVTLRSLNNKESSNWINLKYFQIYTPSNRMSIAIEPMSSPSNAFNIDFPKYLVELNSGDTKEGGFTISIK